MKASKNDNRFKTSFKQLITGLTKKRILTSLYSTYHNQSLPLSLDSQLLPQIVHCFVFIVCLFIQFKLNMQCVLLVLYIKEYTY